MADLMLPAFMMDCRDWMVVSAHDVGLADESDDIPTVAVLSTMIIDEDIHEATGVLTVGLLDADEPLDTRGVAPEADALELIRADDLPGVRRYVIPTPGQEHGTQGLALLAEFTLDLRCGDELHQRIDALMASFRWQQKVPAATPRR